MSCLWSKTRAQSYGLGFESFEAVQDKRTGLDLSPDGQICLDGDFELSFDLAFLRNKKTYFGYIVRVIGDDQQNIDLIYDNSSVDQDHFKLIIGEQFSPIAFDFRGDDLFSKWNRIVLRFQKQKRQITVVYGNRSLSQPVKYVTKGCYKILFGANQYKEFRTTDVPPMKVRDVVLREDGHLAYNWPLDETDGLKASEESHQKSAFAANPVWIKKLHYEWKLLQTVSLKGYVRVGFDEKSSNLFMVGQDSLARLNLAENRLISMPYRSGKQPVYVDNQVLFDVGRNRLYNIFLNEKQVSAFDTVTRAWDKSDIAPKAKTYYLHANKFLSPEDSSIYVLGGYGHLAYKNEVQRYHLGTGTWEQISLKDSTFTPRYLAALGATRTGAYMIGGYGSSTGQQMLNPRNWYDLLYFDRVQRKFKKIYELKVPKEHFVFGNSMIINEQDSTYYALIFPKHQFSSELQLIKGSLTRPEFKIVGSRMSYQFIDIESFADLFYDKANERFVAVTLYRDANMRTKVAVYSLHAPPLETVTPQTASTGNSTGRTVWVIVALAAIVLLAYWLYRYMPGQLGKQKALKTPVIGPVPPQASDTGQQVVEEEVFDKAIPYKSCILLFGNLQLYDEEGNEITKQFSPLVKELFLVILLYSIRWDGISSEKLKELLWFDKPSESARNNRSVNIAKLKAILDKMKHCQVSKETGYWKIKIDFEKIEVDYMHYLNLIGHRKLLTKQSIIELASITKRGNFLSNVEYEWLDSFKSEISNEIVDAYLRYAASVKIADDAEFLVKLANYVFYFDPVNEEAMILKCKALAHLGKHSLAKTTFENFAREYNRIYGEDFRKDMPEVLHS
ncbi:galactose oxidase [Dyadobacter sp. CY261]|uniref:galactose oxidase n=1 Tax=Dyadobacter sp. CY261 TaxID=2907203 RepID=UPI001F339D7D|nr:galactose oxidase [Dyadobacter sp. CY261]MCF0070615.1 galactose oxidase [Dyadobacter sp. CY261]